MDTSHLITISVTLPNRRELEHIAARLSIDEDCVLGKILRVLVWYREGFTASADQLDTLVNMPGFAAALCEPAVGWLAAMKEQVRPRGFLRDEITRIRRRGWRARKGSGDEHPCRAPVQSTCAITSEIQNDAMEGGGEEEKGGRGGYGDEEEDGVVEAQNKTSTESEHNKAHASQKSPKTRPKTAAVFVLPEWIPADVWDEYLKMRVRIRKPLTDYGKALAVKKLALLRLQGEDVRVVLERSILHSWQGMFAQPKPKGRYVSHLRPAANFDDLDYQSGATRAEDYPDWTKGGDV